MRITRVFTGPDNESHFEELDVPLERGRYGAISKFVPSTGIAFRMTDPGGELDFHNAPQRQFVITLEGVVEIECGDGSKRRLGPGDILLADDTWGRGHVTREIQGPRRSLFVPFPPDFDISGWRPIR
jgi:hypothetical protein